VEIQASDDIDVILEDLGVEFRKSKADRNLRERAISFNVAARIFVDRDLVDFPVRESVARSGEERIMTLGIVDGDTLAVIWTPRNGRRRIISARKAHRSERKRL
jgi:hypothetical protein